MARISGKDLAAIAALGVAGTMAYRDYNKKKEASAAKEARDSVQEVADRPLPRQDAADEGLSAAYADPSRVVDEKGPYRPRQEEILDKAPRVAPTRANANAAAAAAAKERARVDALMARAGPRGGNISGRGQNYQDPRLAPNFRDPRLVGASAAANPNMSDMGIGSGMKRGGKVSSKPKANSASSRGDGIAQRGKTRGKYL